MKRFYAFFVMLIAFSCWLNVANAQIVRVPDANLAAVLRHELGLAPNAPITRQAMQSLTFLEAQSYKIEEITGRRGLLSSVIRDITGLEHATGLTRLWLNRNHISDISPLARLTNLEELNIGDNLISDISPLERLTNLEVLYLYSNHISDISSLARLTQLEFLGSGSNLISDISPLARLMNLEELYISSNPISNFQPLAELTQLRDLGITVRRVSDLRRYVDLTQLESLVIWGDGSQISDLHLLSNLTQLRRLTVLSAQIRDIRFLERLTQLASLNLGDNQISDLKPLSALTQLEQLSLTINQISDLKPLSALTRLESLTLWNNQVRDVTPLAGLTNLERLWLARNPIQDASPLANLPNLRYTDIDIPEPPPIKIPDQNLASAVRKALDLHRTTPITQPAMLRLTKLEARESRITNLSGLEYATQLTELDLYNNHIRNLTPLSGLTRLKQLRLDENPIGSIRPLTGLEQLEELYLSGNQIKNKDIQLLANLTELRMLSLNANQIGNIKPLASLTKLERLWLEGNKIRDVSPLAGLVNLETLHLKGNPVKDLSPLANLPKLSDVDIEIPQQSAVQVSAGQHPPMYWIDESGTLHRLINGEVENILPNVQNATSLALDTTEDKIYWTTKSSKTRGKIYRANLNGTGAEELAQVFGIPYNIAVNATGNKLYWTDNRGRVQSANLNGKQIKNIAKNLEMPINITLDIAGGKLYWTETSGRIWRANLNGKSSQDIATGLGAISGIAISGNRLYWTEVTDEDSGKIGASDLDGSNLRTLAMLQSTPANIAVDPVNNKLYWTDSGGNIRRANLNGKSIKKIVSGLVSPLIGFALGSSNATAAAAPPLSLGPPTPDTTHLFANYPNPFNPETWIPYQLATASDVKITIYDARGSVIRQLNLGHQPAGIYTSQSRAAYWDGRNTQGERVASGIYFYQLQTDNVSSLRKMLILK